MKIRISYKDPVQFNPEYPKGDDIVHIRFKDDIDLLERTQEILDIASYR